MPATQNVQLDVAGDVSGQIAIGNNIMQIQNNGGVVYFVQQTSQIKFEKNKGPAERRPRAFPRLLDRTGETEVIRSSLMSKQSVSVYGEDGIGKTTFLSHMAHLPETDAFADGIVYLYSKGLGLDDLLQVIFDSFYSSPGGTMPTAGQLRHRLQSIEAIVLLDELDLGREEAQALLNIMPVSSFILASHQQSLWGDGQTILLRGLPEQEGLDLFARELGRDITADELTDVQWICEHLERHPLRVIQTAALVRSGRAVSDIKAGLDRELPSQVVEREILDGMDDQQKKVLAVLGAGSGALVPLPIISSLTRLSNAQTLLDGLAASGVVWKQGSRYAVARGIVEAAGEMWDLTAWRDTLVNYLADWAARQPEDRLIEDTVDLFQHVLRYAAEKNRWPEIIRIGRVVERILVLQKRWQAWLDILNLLLRAARAARDRHTEAWVLHQLGTRAMCLSYAEQARQFLSEALTLRQALGDKPGIAVTQHNLNGLNVVPTPTGTNGNSSGRGCGRCAVYGVGGLILLVGFMLFGSLLYRVIPSLLASPTPTWTPTNTPTNTSTPTDTVTPSYTPSFTPTNTATFTPSNTPTRTYTPTFTPSFTITPSRTRTPTPTQDIVDPPVPFVVSPKNNFNYDCLPFSQVILDWDASYDPSGISSYNIELLGSPNNSNWVYFWLYTVSGNTTSKNVTNDISSTCGFYGYYRWRIKANDGASNDSAWSSWYYFRAVEPIE